MAQLEGLREWVDAGLSYFYPEICQLCAKGRATAREGYVCGACRATVRYVQPPFCDRCGLPFEGELTGQFECANCREMDLQFSSARSAVVATGVAREAIHRYKYQRALWFEPFLADLFLQQALTDVRERKWELIVPVPLHGLKEREREFNQAERLARHLSLAANIPMNAKVLERVEATRTQTLLSREDRAANVKRAFAVRKGVELKGARVLLVDDVLTTGATTSACAKVLRRAGAGDVGVWTVARGMFEPKLSFEIQTRT